MLFPSKTRVRKRQQGYIMMTLLLMIALMMIFTAAILPEITFEIKRDREQEMIHRGVQYSRAIRAYYKKFGRYPAKIEDLENTNQQRFLRKRYKDPLTNKDFRLLHFGEAKLALNGMGAGMIAGASPVGMNAPGGLTQTGGFAQPSAFGANSAFGTNSTFGANTTSTFGQNTQVMNQTAAGNASPAGSDATQPGTPVSEMSTSPGGSSSITSGGFGSSTSGSTNTTFGGAPIVGVASLSKDLTIRIFDKKKKYNEWQFVYDPTMDRGFLITTPYQQQIGFGFTGTPNLNNQINGSNATGDRSGSPSGLQNSPSPMNNGLGNPNQPTDVPLQQ